MGRTLTDMWGSVLAVQCAAVERRTLALIAEELSLRSAPNPARSKIPKRPKKESGLVIGNK